MSEELRKDSEVREDKEIIIEAVKNDSSVLEYVNEEIHSEIIKAIAEEEKIEEESSKTLLAQKEKELQQLEQEEKIVSEAEKLLEEREKGDFEK